MPRWGKQQGSSNRYQQGQQGQQLQGLNSFGGPQQGSMYQSQLRALFDAVDKDRSGTVENNELQQILARNGLMFSLKTINQMIRSFDTGQRGNLSFNDFINLHNFLLNMQNSYKAFDLDKNGSLSIDEVYQAVNSAGFQIDKQALIASFTIYDPDRTESLDLAEYIALCMFLQGAGRVFNAFDSQRAGRITVDFNQFLYAAANIG